MNKNNSITSKDGPKKKQQQQQQMGLGSSSVFTFQKLAYKVLHIKN